MQLLRPNEVAEALACSRSEVYALKDAGKLPFVKIGGMVRFRKEDIEEFIITNLVTSAEQAKTPLRLPRLKHLRA